MVLEKVQSYSEVAKTDFWTVPFNDVRLGAGCIYLLYGLSKLIKKYVKRPLYGSLSVPFQPVSLHSGRPEPG